MAPIGNKKFDDILDHLYRLEYPKKKIFKMNFTPLFLLKFFRF